MAFDVVIRGGEVIDGTGKTDRFRADVGIQDGRVEGIGDLSDAETARTIDAGGHVVCPGFIDVHVHSENSLLGGRDQMGGLRQGVTTHLLAPDGFGWAGLSPEEALPALALHAVRLRRAPGAGRLAHHRFIPGSLSGPFTRQRVSPGTALRGARQGHGLGPRAAHAGSVEGHGRGDPRVDGSRRGLPLPGTWTTSPAPTRPSRSWWRSARWPWSTTGSTPPT